MKKSELEKVIKNKNIMIDILKSHTDTDEIIQYETQEIKILQYKLDNGWYTEG